MSATSSTSARETRGKTPPGTMAGEEPRQSAASTPDKRKDGEQLMRLARLGRTRDGGERWTWFGWEQIDGVSVMTALIATYPTSWEREERWALAFHRLRACESDARALEAYVKLRYPGAAWRWLFGADADALAAELTELNGAQEGA